MAATASGPDFITVDGGEGGTGAAPLAFSDHVAMPFKLGFASVYSRFARAGIAEDVTFIGAGRLGVPGRSPARVRARLRHGQRGPRGDAGHRVHPGGALPHRRVPDRGRHPWLMRGLDPGLKHARAANYIVALRAELLSLARACGVRHPALIDPDRIEIVSAGYRSTPMREVFGYEPDWPLISDARRTDAAELIGRPMTTPPPGPKAGEHAGIPGAGDPTRSHMDARSLGETASEAG